MSQISHIYGKVYELLSEDFVMKLCKSIYSMHNCNKTGDMVFDSNLYLKNLGPVQINLKNLKKNHIHWIVLFCMCDVATPAPPPEWAPICNPRSLPWHFIAFAIHHSSTDCISGLFPLSNGPSLYFVFLYSTNEMFIFFLTHFTQHCSLWFHRSCIKLHAFIYSQNSVRFHCIYMPQFRYPLISRWGWGVGWERIE